MVASDMQVKESLEGLYNELRNIESLLGAVGDALGMEDSDYDGALFIAKERVSAMADTLYTQFLYSE